MRKFLIAMAAVGLVVIAVAFIVRPKPCTGNFLQDDLACTMIGDQK